MRILIFSDTHNDILDCISIIKETEKVDMILHAGDCVDDAEQLMLSFPQIPVYHVKGNCDFFTSAPDERIIEAGGKRIFLTHGHKQLVKMDYHMLISQAREKNADLVVFGHTHLPYQEMSGNLTVLNPGSLRYGKTYAVCEINDSVLKTRLCKLEE